MSVGLAGCLAGDEETDGGTSNMFVVAVPSDTAPPAEYTTSVDDDAIEGPIEAVVIEAVETNSMTTQRLDEDEQQAVADRIDDLPQYTGDDEYQPAAYVTKNDSAVAVFYEQED